MAISNLIRIHNSVRVVSIVRSVFGVSFAVCLILCALANAVAGQATRSMDQAARRVDDFNKQGEKYEKDQMGRESGARKPSNEELKRVAALNKQIVDDLETLQSQYNEMLTKLKSREPMSEAYIVEANKDINQRAVRLMKNLGFPKAEGEASEIKITPELTEPKRGLTELCKRLFAFITSPFFDNTRTFDPETAKTTRRELQYVILISDLFDQTPN